MVKKNFSDRIAIPCSTLFNDKEIAEIFLNSSKIDFNFLEIKKNKMPDLNLKFRYLTYEEKDYIIEIVLLINSKKYLIIHLNPALESVKNFLYKVSITKILAFHFFSITQKMIVTSYTQTDREQDEWFKRNYSKAKIINKNSIQTYSNYLSENLTSKQRLYCQYDVNVCSFCSDSKKLIEMEEISGYLD